MEELELELIDYGLEEIGEDSEGNIIIRTPLMNLGIWLRHWKKKELQL